MRRLVQRVFAKAVRSMRSSNRAGEMPRSEIRDKKIPRFGVASQSRGGHKRSTILLDLMTRFL
jgi:hypothetical protein